MEPPQDSPSTKDKSRSNNRRRRGWLWGTTLCLAITALSSFPGVGVTSFEFPHQDKLIHYLVFGLIATAWLRWLRTRMSVKKAAIAAWSITACFGLTDEIHQAFVPGRTMDVLDWLADALGALTAVLVYTYWPLYRNFLEWPRRS